MAETSSFTQWLRARSEPDWTAVINHPFTDALFAGTMPDDRMRSYLVQDYQFVDDFLALLGSALAKADRYASRLAIAGSITALTSDENTYFQRAFDALGVPEADRVDPALDSTTIAFRDLMTEAKASDTYQETLAVLTVAEWTYLEWASRAPAELPPNFVHAEWITLHNNDEFRSWVQWLLAEFDRVGADLSGAERERCLKLFRHATELELSFFNAHWW